MKMRDELKSIMWDLIEAVEKDHHPKQDDQYFQTIFNPDTKRVISYPNKINSEYIHALRVLRRKTRAQRKFLSDNKLENLLNDSVMRLKYSTSSNLNNEIDSEITNIFDEIKILPNERHIFLIPIVRIEIINNKKITIGNSQIFNINLGNLKQLQEEYNVNLYFLSNDIEKGISETIKVNDTKVYAKVIVDAGDTTKARYLALEKAETCLNILRLFAPNTPIRLRGDVHSPVNRRLIAANLDTKNFHGVSETVNIYVKPHFIDERFIESLEKSGLDFINYLLNKEKRLLTELERNLLRAIFWFGDACKDRYFVSRFLKYIISIEIILLKGERNKKEVISRRLSSVLYSNDKMEDAYQEMKRLYQIRNEIIHSGLDFVEIDDVGQVMLWNRALIFKLLKLVKKYVDIEILIEKEFTVK